MNNTDKLLRAFIEASGFDVEEVETKIPTRMQVGVNPMFNIPTFADSHDVIIDYKVTKKSDKISYACTKCGTHIAYGNSLTSCLCKSTKNLIRIDK